MKLRLYLFIAVISLAIVLSVFYGRQMEGFASRSSTQSSEGFMDAGTGAAIGVGVLGVVVIGAFFYGIKPERVF